MNDEFTSVSAAAAAALNVCNERLAAAKDHPTKGVQVHVEMSVTTARLLATEALQSPTAAVVETATILRDSLAGLDPTTPVAMLATRIALLATDILSRNPQPAQ